MSQDPAEQNIQMWKVKKLIKSLDAARGYIPSTLPRIRPCSSHVPERVLP